MVELKCSLCIMTFETNDPDCMKRMARHNLWHSTALSQHRNTTQGDPTYD